VAGCRWTSKKPSSPAWGWPDWTNPKSGAGRPGTAGSPSRCSPTPSSPRPPPTNALTHPAPDDLIPLAFNEGDSAIRPEPARGNGTCAVEELEVLRCATVHGFRAELRASAKVLILWCVS